MISKPNLRPAKSLISRSSHSLGWIEVSLLALVLLIGVLGASVPSDVQATVLMPQAKSPIYVPMVSNGVSSHVDSVQEAKPVCQLNGPENAVLAAMMEHPEQRRATIECNPVLSRVARAKAADMAKRNYVAHVDPDGVGPNALATAGGFRLPDWYPKTGSANNIESIGAGYAGPPDVWSAWLNSHYHRIHVLGTDDFYAGQHQVGVGYYYDENSYYKHYWVVMSAPTETK